MAKRKPLRRIDKQLERELREPDEFFTWMDRFAKYADDHRPLVISGFIALILVVAAGNGIVVMVKHHAEKRHAAEFIALQTIGDSLQKKGDDSAWLTKMDGLIAKASGKNHRATLYLTKADMLLSLGEYAKAAEAYEGALAHATKGVTRDLAAIGLASARMKAGDLAQADASLKGVDGPLAPVAQVERVRLAMAQHNYGEAQSVVTLLEAGNPNSPALAEARNLVKDIPSAPAEPTAAAASTSPAEPAAEPPTTTEPTTPAKPTAEKAPAND